MRGIFVFGVVVLACITLTSARRPAKSKKLINPVCREIRRNGCSQELKQTGQVCGTDGKTYRNACLLEKKACKLSTTMATIEIAYNAPCGMQPRQQQTGGTGGEETVVGVGPEGENEPGDTPDGEDTPDLPDTPDATDPQDPGAQAEVPDGTDAPDTPDTTDSPDTPDVEDPGDQAIPDGTDAPDTPDTPDQPDTPDVEDPGTQANPDATDAPDTPDAVPSPKPGSDSSGSSGSSSSEEVIPSVTGATPTGATMEPTATSQPPLSPVTKVCPDKCPEPLKQEMVCASDDETYGSICLLQQHMCQTNQTLSVVHRGSCNNTCGEECPMVYEPVCGTDDLTYMSRCDLMRTACLTQDDTLQVAYNQECAGVALLKGCKECEPIPEPVCSTNNMTFRSQCEFERFVCIFDVRGIDIAYNDSCPGAPLVCPNYCEQIKDPVCASDGITYPNVCEVGVADCHAKTIDPMAQVGFVSYGPCPEGTPDPCSPTSPECELIEEPVCAMKGKEMVSYYNRCFFEKEVCFDPSIKFVKDGVCNPNPARVNVAPPP